MQDCQRQSPRLRTTVQFCWTCRRNTTTLRKLVRKALMKCLHDRWGQAMSRVAEEECQSFRGHQCDGEDAEAQAEAGVGMSFEG